MTEPLATILPVYFVADESNSMSEDVGQLNQGLRSLLDALQSEAMAASKVRFSVIGFADNAVCYLPPTDLRRIETMPTMSVRGSTSFAAAFDELTTRIPADVHTLREQHYAVNRPAVFFLTDGAPNHGDGWEAALARLEAIKARPNVLAFGIGDANADVIRKVASKPEYAFIAVPGSETGTAIAKFIKALTQSVINSGHSLASGEGTLQIKKPDDYLNLSVDLIE
jgi:uncharacterized protein YegL